MYIYIYICILFFHVVTLIIKVLNANYFRKNRKMPKKPSYNINNQKKTIKTKRKENVTLFGSIHHTASQLKPISGEYSSN